MIHVRCAPTLFSHVCTAELAKTYAKKQVSPGESQVAQVATAMLQAAQAAAPLVQTVPLDPAHQVAHLVQAPPPVPLAPARKAPPPDQAVPLAPARKTALPPLERAVAPSPARQPVDNVNVRDVNGRNAPKTPLDVLRQHQFSEDDLKAQLAASQAEEKLQRDALDAVQRQADDAERTLKDAEALVASAKRSRDDAMAKLPAMKRAARHATSLRMIVEGLVLQSSTDDP